jgi:hypothetical protein
MRYLIIFIAVLMCGCGTTKTSTTDGYRVKEVTKETPTADGGRLIEKTVTHEGEATTVETTTPDAATSAAIGSIAPVLGGAIGVATGTTGFPWGEIIGGVATIAATGWAALKHGQSSELKKQVAVHKNDADSAWDESLALAKAIRPEDLKA